MTGPEHYRHAEQHLAAAERSATNPGRPLATARVHALLALAAAVTLTDPQSRTSTATSLAWAEVTEASFAGLSSEGR